MRNGEIEEKFREEGNNRSSNSLVWTGFALTNFVTIVAIFSAFGLEIRVPFQFASGLFLMSGTFFSLSWALYETAGSAYKPRLAVDARPYRIWKLRNVKNEKFVPNLREIYVKQAEYCVLLDILVWTIGIAILLWDLKMYITLLFWISSLTFAYSFILPRYFKWRDKQE